MDVEEFKQKYKELKDNPMYKNFCSILDTKTRILEKLLKENEQLKEQLHEASLQIQNLIEEDMGCPDNCSKFRKFKEQQKEFIEWLEKEKDRLKRECSPIYEDSLGKVRLVSEDIHDETNRILLKYREIIGGNNDR